MTDVGGIAGARFRKDRPSYARMLDMVQRQERFAFVNDDALPCMCHD